ncbi:hypothetical protein FRC11_009611, partial [Ceratobasidium sp. 423]
MDSVTHDYWYTLTTSVPIYRQDEKLSDGWSGQAEYLDGCGVESGHVHVLEQHQQHDEVVEPAVQAAFGQSSILEGVRWLQSFSNPDSLRQAIQKTLGGLWVLFPLGRQIDTVDDRAADALIQCLSNVSGVFTEEEMHQLEVFRVIRTGDQVRIGSLAQFHSALTSDSPYRSTLSLLCFSRSSGSLIPSREWSIHDFINTAKLTWKYLNRLFILARTLDVSEPWTKRLLGLLEHKSLSNESGQDSFQIYSTSPLFSHLEPPSSDTLVHNDSLNATSTTSTKSNTHKLALDTLYSLLRTEVHRVHEAVTSPNFQVLYPCHDCAVFGTCKRPSCGKQHVNSVRISENDLQITFNLRTRALIMQIHLVDKYYAQTRLHEVERRNMRRTWVHKMYETLMPLFPPLGGVYCMDGGLIPELDKGAYLISMWCHQALFELDPRYGAEHRFLSNALAFMDLTYRVDGKGFAQYADSLYSSRLVKPRQDLMISDLSNQSNSTPHSIMHDFIDFYRRKSDDVIRRVIRATQHVMSSGLAIEANLLTHLLEFIGREIIVQYRVRVGGAAGVFDGLMAPRSWVLDLVKRAPLISQKGFGSTELTEYLSTLYKMLENLREYSLESS